MSEKRPAIFIPTLYFAEGLPYTVVNLMSAVFFKSMGADNVFIGRTSLLSLPWVFKFLWSPLVDYCATKKRWIVMAQFILAIFLGALAGASAFTQQIGTAALLFASAASMFLIALASATHDIAIDGYYLDVLDQKQQAYYVGVRTAIYKIAVLFGSGTLVYLAGELGKKFNLPLGWSAAFVICAAIFLAAGFFHSFYLPEPKPAASSVAHENKLTLKSFGLAITTYFQQPGIVPIICFTLFFRLGDALMLKQAAPFLLDPPASGGAGLSVSEMGIVSGTVGTLALLVSGILGSWLISRDGLKRWIWPFCIVQNAAIPLYFLLAKYPGELGSICQRIFGPLPHPLLPAVYLFNSIEQFAYGLGVSAFTVFLLSTVRGDLKAAHYAVASALMACGNIIPATFSGDLYKQLGYVNFFAVASFACIPGIISIFYLPLWKQREESESGTQ